MVSSHFLEFAVDGGSRYDHFGYVSRDIVDGVATILSQVNFVGFPNMPDAEPFVDSFVYPDPQENLTSLSRFAANHRPML